MPVTPDILRRLGKLNLDPAALSEVLSIIADMQEADDDRKRKQRERTAKHRAGRNVTVTPPNGGGGVTLPAGDGNSDSPSPSPDPSPPRVDVDVDVGAHARETLPADWQPDESDRAYLRDQGGLTAADLAIDLEGFRLAAEESTEPIRKPRSAFRAFCLSPKAPHRRQAAASPSLSVVNGAKSHADPTRHADPRSHRDFIAQRNWEAIERRMAANPYYSRSG